MSDRLTEIEDRPVQECGWKRGDTVLWLSGDDVDWLIAEVKRLRAHNAVLVRAADEMIDHIDYKLETARDALGFAVNGRKWKHNEGPDQEWLKEWVGPKR